MISVLYVDDEPGLLELVKTYLERDSQFTVDVITSARAALNLLDQKKYDAIVSDYMMPEMDGIRFLKKVRTSGNTIPFILFTGRGREEVVIDAINNGADFYIQKGGAPQAQFAELAHKVRQAMRRREAERSLKDSERRLADIIDFLPHATFAIDRDGKVIAWNRAVEEMTGVPAGEMLGKGDRAYSIPFYGSKRPVLVDLLDEPEEEIAHYYANTSREGSVIRGEADLSGPNGQGISVHAKACPLYNQAGEVVGAIESIRDVTARNRLKADLAAKHAELQASYELLAATEEQLRGNFEELARSERRRRIDEKRLVMAQEIGHIGSWEYDLGTEEIWASSEGLRIFGLPPEAGPVPVNRIEARIPERNRVHQALADLIAEGREYDLEFVVNPADGAAPRTVHSVARLEKDADGNPLRVVGVVQDIT
ncbi:MAG TPA: response regulator [Methanoregulaceae archaeon]|nr:response regulator [Methanoregulaceae archaeon]